MLLPAPEAIAEGLNPLTISHAATTISCTIIGKLKTIWAVESGGYGGGGYGGGGRYGDRRGGGRDSGGRGCGS